MSAVACSMSKMEKTTKVKRVSLKGPFVVGTWAMGVA